MEEKNTVDDDYYDMFRNLPDEILCHIVSFLPNESALETSLISTRWRNLWNEALIRYGSKDEVTNIISGFLTSFEVLDPLKHPRKLQFHFSEDSEELLVATIANNSKLLIEFKHWNHKKEPQIQFQYELNLNLNIQHCFHCKPFSSNFIVKALYLKSVSNLTSDVASSIVSSLDHIENLAIVECNELKFLSIDSSSSRLSKLTILDCLQIKSLHLRTSKLRSFRYRGPLPQIQPEYHFNLSDAMLDFRLGPSCINFNAKDFDATLLTIKNSQVLTLCKWTFEESIWPSISDLFGNFKFYKLRELCWIESYESEYNSMEALLSFLKLCPELEQLVVTIDPESYSARSSNSCLMQETKSTKLEHLKQIKFMGFTSCVNEISVAKKLVELFNGKPHPMILASDGSCLDAEHFVSNENEITI